MMWLKVRCPVCLVTFMLEGDLGERTPCRYRCEGCGTAVELPREITLVASGPYAAAEEAVARCQTSIPHGSPLLLPNGRWTYTQGDEDRDRPPMGVFIEDWRRWWDAGEVVRPV